MLLQRYLRLGMANEGESRHLDDVAPGSQARDGVRRGQVAVVLGERNLRPKQQQVESGRPQRLVAGVGLARLRKKDGRKWRVPLMQ